MISPRSILALLHLKFAITYLKDVLQDRLFVIAGTVKQLQGREFQRSPASMGSLFSDLALNADPVVRFGLLINDTTIERRPQPSFIGLRFVIYERQCPLSVPSAQCTAGES